MVYIEHDLVKAEKIVNAAVGLVEQQVTLPKLVNFASLDEFKGAKDDTITQRLPGRLPGRTYDFRNDRSEGIIFDIYKEGLVTMTMGGHAYSGVELSDEQRDFDLGGGYGPLLGAQADAVVRVLNEGAANLITGANYKVTIGRIEEDLRGALVEARRVLNALRVPGNQRILLIGTNVEAALLLDEKITIASNVGDARADNALTDATLGKLMGFTVVADPTIDPDTAYAFVPDAFAFRTAAPTVPNGVPFGTTKSWEGFALRFMQDYDPRYFVDRSVVDAWFGSAPVEDMLYPVKNSKLVNFDPASLNKYFLRGIKLTLGGTSRYPTEADITAETGLSAAGAWTPRTFGAEPVAP